MTDHGEETPGGPASGRSHASAGQTTWRAFVDSLARRAAEPHREPLPPAATVQQQVRRVSSHEDWVTRFTAEAEAVGCEIVDARGGNLADALVPRLELRPDLRVHIDTSIGEAVGRDAQAALAEHITAAGAVIETATTPDTLFDIDLAITGVQAAIAETGTIIWESSAERLRLATLAPAIHVAMVRVEQIVADLVDALTELSSRHAQPANVNLITGPSKTADIEGTLVTGVHGPGRVVVVLVD